MTAMLAIVGGVLVIVLLVIAISRTRHSQDGVDSFRRQIDALSPEARRPVIDQIYQSTDRPDQRIDPRIDPRPSDSDPSPSSGASAESDETIEPDGSTDIGDTGEDGVHGT